MTNAASFNSVQKVCGILRVLGAGAPARLTDIAEAASMNKVTALRILETLIAEGFVQRSRRTRRIVSAPRQS
jgi:DNA-binding IclR family transcriptional regulator